VSPVPQDRLPSDSSTHYLLFSTGEARRVLDLDRLHWAERMRLRKQRLAKLVDLPVEKIRLHDAFPEDSPPFTPNPPIEFKPRLMELD
jgi:hypothetical protein